ncbi:phosphoenolpyruvate--protein phosphotransferase [bacterium]|nr:phosphoenolpyruvate--protein phosphotransferase [bacterium]MBU1636711.1 phosphoenolpyruvate--protein phosphotransferase [bacterium]MBU1920024.1 phosphoenolpyruvate--protein phosphotransferase [bacterium]
MKTDSPKKPAEKVRSKKESTLRGIPASPGISIGCVHLLQATEEEIQPRKIAPSEVKSELAHFETALASSRTAIERSREKATALAGIAVGKIFDAHLMILEDVVFREQVETRVKREQFSVDYIVFDVLGRNIEMMESQDGELFRERAADIRDVRQRLLRNLRGEGDIMPNEPTEPVILVASNLSPTHALHIDRNLVKGIATDTGGLTSHTAILARSMNIPSVVGLGDLSSRVISGDPIIINGNSGKVLIHPSAESGKEYKQKQDRYQKFMKSLENLREKPAETADGHRIQVWGNIELPLEAESVLAHGGTGIGLFRSEFLFLTRESVPSEDEQFDTYDKAADIMAPYPVIIRTFDLGGDKLHHTINLQKEKNPFLGYRAIRVCLSRRDLFRAQLRAILRASSRGNVRIMFPFVSGLEELREAKIVVKEAAEELAGNKVPIEEQIKVGVMIELPSAAMLADKLSEECDFFSIGTNDLIQYMVAADRGNDMVSAYYRSFHPAVIRMIQSTVKAAHKNNTPVGICGELGANPIATPLLVGLDIDEISTNSAFIPEIKKIVRAMTYVECKRITHRVLKLGTALEISDYLETQLKKKLADLPIWFN